MHEDMMCGNERERHSPHCCTVLVTTDSHSVPEEKIHKADKVIYLIKFICFIRYEKE